MEISLRVILVEPRYEGNVGSVARIVKNFGYRDLFLVRPCKIGETARIFAVHAKDVLENSKIFDSIGDAIDGSSLVVGTTSKRVSSISPDRLSDFVRGGTVSLLFGREDFGLTNDELNLCDLIVRIPTSEEYPTMNLSHAVAIVLYELSRIKPGPREGEKADREGLLSHYELLLRTIGYPEHKFERAIIMLRRIFARADLSQKEVSMLRGILRKTLWKVRNR